MMSANLVYQCPMPAVSRIDFQQQFTQEATRVTRESAARSYRPRPPLCSSHDAHL